MTLYDNEYINKLIEKFSKRENFQMYTITGCLLDNYILTADKTKTAVIKEKYLNSWSSAYSLILYNKTPKKYQEIIDLLENDQTEKAEKKFFA